MKADTLLAQLHTCWVKQLPQTAITAEQRPGRTAESSVKAMSSNFDEFPERQQAGMQLPLP